MADRFSGWSTSGQREGVSMLKRTLLSIGIFWLTLAPSRLAAQAVGGTVLGFVRDASGAAIANAPVTIVAVDSGLGRTVRTDSSGEYGAPSLPPGAYTVSVEMQGFKKTTLSNLQLGVDQKLRVDVTLEVGAVTETIMVEGQAPVVKSDTSELGDTVTERQI